MTLTQLCESIDPKQLFVDLGGKWQGNRARAFWRDGDGPNIGLNRKRGFPYHDHAHDKDISVIELIRLAFKCDSKRAVAWLESYAGVRLDSKQPDELRNYQQQIEIAEYWRTIKIWDLGEYCNALDSLKARTAYKPNLQHYWEKCCRLQRDAQAEIEQLKSLRGHHLIRGHAKNGT